VSAYLEYLIRYSNYIIGGTGLILIIMSLGFSPKKTRERFRVMRDLKYQSYSSQWMKYDFLRRYNHLLSASLKSYRYEYFAKFIIVQLLIFLGLLIFGSFFMQSIWYGLITSLTFVYVFPVTFFYMKHKQVQGLLQNEVIDSVITLLQSYQRNQNNMLYALKDVSDSLEGKTKAAYSKLFARMHDRDEIKILASETFAFQLGSLRGKNISTTILKACKDGLIVETLLQDLIVDMTEQNKVLRDAESEAREAAILGYAPLPLTFLFLYLNEAFLIPGGNSLKYQFGTPQGIQSFVISIIFGIVGLGLAILVKKPKKQ